MPTRRTILVVDLAFGDCGKGTIVDFLARRSRAGTVVRFNGGPQAAHNVVTPGGRRHTFAQFGSGTFVHGVRTLLSRFVLIDPYALFNEAAHLDSLGVIDALSRLVIDARCTVITPAHQAANRLRELSRGDAAHGTCGMGIGETMQDAIDRPELTLRAGELGERLVVRRKLRETVNWKREQLRDVIAALGAHPKASRDLQTLLQPTWLEVAVDNYAALAGEVSIAGESVVSDILRADGTMIFEGAQGVLLDEWFGFHPHTTWSTTTFENAETLLDEAGYDGERTRVGVLRSYFTRHGNGPLVTEDRSLAPRLPELHNGDSGWQGRFRVGPFDAVAARYALDVTGPVDALAVTHLDRLAALPPRVCTAYECDGETLAKLQVRRPTDLDYQERLTNLLRRSRPVYTPLPGGDDREEMFIKLLRDELRTPIGIVSRGPTAADKAICGTDVSPVLAA